MKKLLLITLLAASSLAGAQEREWAPYKKLVDTMRLDKFYALPATERDKLDYYVLLKPANKALKASDFNLTVVHSGGRTPLPVGPDGRLRLALNAKWLSEDAKIVTTQPSGEKVQISQGMDAIVPEGQQWQYNALMDSVPQSNNMIGKLAGIARVFFPTLKGVTLKFDKPAQLIIQAKAGAKQLSTDAKNEIHLALDSALQKENPLVVVTARPHEAELDE
ncbi:MAG TPA: DUF2987 domain-containing protein [Pseudoduganella sp.]